MSEINYEIISQYLDGELTGEALTAFEKQMQEDAELAAEVNIYRTIESDQSFNILNKAEKEKLAASLTGLTKDYFKKNEAKVIGINRWWYAAAAVAATVVFILILRPFGGETFDNEKLFAYYSKNIESLSAGERGADNDTLILQAINLFNKKDYEQSLPLLKKILTSKPNETDLIIATGICYLQTNHPDSAIKIFDRVANGNTVYKSEAIWYKALALLKENKPEECYKVLESLPADADNIKEAKELMKKIKEK
jgi:tetratricopeptide (TPR) repeat protein